MARLLADLYKSRHGCRGEPCEAATKKVAHVRLYVLASPSTTGNLWITWNGQTARGMKVWPKRKKDGANAFSPNDLTPDPFRPRLCTMCDMWVELGRTALQPKCWSDLRAAIQDVSSDGVGMPSCSDRESNMQPHCHSKPFNRSRSCVIRSWYLLEVPAIN